jgi:hypothetical protein
MIEIRACTPDDAAAVSTLLSELGYTVPTDRRQRTFKSSAKPGRIQLLLPSRKIG